MSDDYEVPLEILSTSHLLDHGPSCAGYEGEKQYRWALRKEQRRRLELERELAELRLKVAREESR